MEELLSFTCPCCSAYLTIDEAGDIQGEPAPAEDDLAENEFIGLNGIKSVDARANWRQLEYFHNSQQPIPSERTEPISKPKEPMKVEQPHQHDDKMLAAIKRDLDKHGINNNLSINDK